MAENSPNQEVSAAAKQLMERAADVARAQLDVAAVREDPARHEQMFAAAHKHRQAEVVAGQALQKLIAAYVRSAQKVASDAAPQP